MYVLPLFKVHPALALGFAEVRGFGLMIASDGGGPAAEALATQNDGHANAITARLVALRPHLSYQKPELALAAHVEGL